VSRKDIETTKRQLLDIISISNTIWINEVARTMLNNYGKSKTAWYPAYKQLLKSGHVQKFKKTYEDPRRIYLKVNETHETDRIKNHNDSLEITRKQFCRGIRYLQQHPLLTKFSILYEHNTIAVGRRYVFINDRPTWKTGEKVSQFNNPDFLKGKVISSYPYGVDVSYNAKSYGVFNALLHLIENLFNNTNSLMIGLGLGHFDKLYEKTINSQYKKALNRIQIDLAKLIDSFDEDQRDYIDNLIQQKFTWFEPLYEIFDRYDHLKRDYVEALPSRI